VRKKGLKVSQLILSLLSPVFSCPAGPIPGRNCFFRNGNLGMPPGFCVDNNRKLIDENQGKKIYGIDGKKINLTFNENPNEKPRYSAVHLRIYYILF
jgi:hypothetical protein